jgi:hypothetical protein
MLRQLNCSTRTPPSVGPIAVPTLAIAVQMPFACAFCLGSGNAALTRASEVTVTVAAAAPCTPRAMVSTSSEGAVPQTVDASVKTPMPITYQRRRSCRSASVAAVMITTAIPRL